MYARVARFEGLDRDRIDEDIAEMKRQMDAGRSGDLPEGAPEEARALMETVTRWVQLVDREKGTAVGIAFCASEEDARRADEVLNAMSPGEGQGRRIGPPTSTRSCCTSRSGSARPNSPRHEPPSRQFIAREWGGTGREGC